MSNKIEVGGVCHFVGEVEVVGAKGFKKRTFAIKSQDEGRQYPTIYAFTLKQDKVDYIKPSDIGAHLVVTAYVESREWQNPKTGKMQFFTDVTAVKILHAGAANTGAVKSAPEAAAQAEPEEFSEDLPF